MADKSTKQMFETAEQVRAAIAAIIVKRSIEASQSEYDMKVCVGAVGAASYAFERVPIEGTATEYGQAVVAVLAELHDTYNDPDGEYTSGRAPIGHVYYDVSRLIDERGSSEI